MLAADDRRWLDAAVRQAAPYAGTTADNPAVAALVVDPQSQKLVARAVTGRGGRPHAEAAALERAGFEAAGCTLYVTLEPCRHWGRTPPCVDAIIRAGIMRVVIGTTDPDPRMAGGTVALLESAGIETVLADHAPSRDLHHGHKLRHTEGRPLVTVVMTVSSDDRLIPPGPGRAAAEDCIDVLRSRSDAVLIGAATARRDDPRLTVALPGLAERTPLRVVLAGAGGVDRSMGLIGGFSGYRTAVIAEMSAPVEAPVSVETIRVSGEDRRPGLAAALRALAERHVKTLLVEPGQRLAAALFEAELVDRLVLLRSQDTIGPAGLAASADGAIADVAEAAGLGEIRRDTLGAVTLTLYERAPRAE